MPTTNRPFFANFFAAFRAHSALQKPTPSPSTSAAASSSTTTASQTASSSTAAPSSARSIHTKANPQQPQTTSSAASAAMMQAASQHFANAAAQARTLPRSPPTATSPYSPPTTPFARSRTPSATRGGRDRRGSDSSSDVSMSPAFRSLPGADALRAEKWYIGGRTATGEERFYKLGMVKKYRSQDRLSLDRISL